MSRISENTRLTILSQLRDLPQNLISSDLILVQRGLETYRAERNKIRLPANQIDYSGIDVQQKLDDLDDDLGDLEQDINQWLIGMVASFASNTAPNGWLLCDGGTIPTTGTFQGVNASLLQNLRNFLGSTFGSYGQLPDLRGEFVRGWDAGRGIDSGRTFGSQQQDEFKMHHHLIGARNGGGRRNPRSSQIRRIRHWGSSGIQHINRSEAVGGTETRPRNVSLLYCIKY